MFLLVIANIVLFYNNVFTSKDSSTAIMGDEDILMGMHPYDIYTINLPDDKLDIIEFTTRSGKECVAVSYDTILPYRQLTLQCSEKSNGDQP